MIVPIAEQDLFWRRRVSLVQYAIKSKSWGAPIRVARCGKWAEYG
jgi:hypothetical protein